MNRYLLTLAPVLFLLACAADGPSTDDEAPTGGETSGDGGSPYGERGSWALTFGGEGDQVVRSSFVDAAGNITVAGLFDGELVAGRERIESRGGTDGFVARVGAEGWLDWVTQIGGAGDDGVSEIDVDATGAVAVAGWYGEDLDRDGITYMAYDARDAFIMVLDADGSERWWERIGSPGPDTGSAAAFDANGNVYFVGNVEQNPDYGAGESAPTGSSALVLACYGPGGEFQWSSWMTGRGTAWTTDLGVAPSGQVVIAGNFTDEREFEDGLLVASAGERAGFVAVWSPLGVLDWSRVFQGDSATVEAVSIDPRNEDVAIAGTFSGSLDVAGADSLVSDGGSDVFVARYTADGVLRWACSVGGSGDERAHAVLVDDWSYVVVSASFTGDLTEGGRDHTARGLRDCLYAIYNPAGAPVWSADFGGMGDETADMGLDDRDNVFLVADFDRDFDAAGTVHESGGAHDILIARVGALDL